MKKFLILIASLFFLISCNDQTTNNLPQITTSIVPLSSITKNIWWNNIEVKNIISSGQSPHNFSLKPSHLMNIEKSDGIISIGLEHIDGFLKKNIKNKNTLVLANFFKLKDKDSQHTEHKKNTEHHHSVNPHIWNSPENAKIIAQKITEFLAKIQPKNTDIFQKNTDIFIKKIDALVENFKQDTKGKQQKYFIVFHDAYDYLFDDVGIDTNKKLVFRKSILNEPNSQDMKHLLDEIQENQIEIAFIEPQFQSPNFETFAKKHNIKIYTLDPLGNDESANWYLKNLETNLKNLREIFGE